GERRTLTAAGMRFGRRHLFLRPLLKPQAIALRAMLWAIAHGLPLPAPIGRPGAWSVVQANTVPAAFHLACGYVPAGRLAIRVDRLQLLAERTARRDRHGPFEATDDLAALVAAEPAD